jgi:hypothetical protein
VNAGWLALLLVSCAALPHSATPLPQATEPTLDVAVWLDSRFNPAENAAARAALEEWNDALGGYAHFFVESDKLDHPSADPIVISSAIIRLGPTVTIDREPDDCAVCSWHVKYLAWMPHVFDRDIHIISSRIERDHDDFRGIVEHEIGHFLGLKHVETPAQLMSDHIEIQCMCVDEDTLRRVAKLHRWNFDHMRPGCR